MKINNTEYKFKVTARAMFIFESITKKSFQIESLLDEYVYFYSIILANNRDTTMTFDEFISYIDEDPSILFEMKEELESYSKIHKLLSNKEEDNNDKKKD